MGIFNFLFNLFKFKKEESVGKEVRIQLTKKTDDLDRNLKEVRDNNLKWNESFRNLISRRELASVLEKEKKYPEAIDLYIKNIDYCENDKYVNSINHYVHDIERVIVLYGKIKEYNKLRSFLERIISSYPTYCDVIKWKSRLAKLTNSDFIETIRPATIRHPLKPKETIGSKIRKYKKEINEFNFYYDMPDGMSTLEYMSKYPDRCYPSNKSEYTKLKKYFEVYQDKGKLAENQCDYKKAIEIYEKKIVEECDLEFPYERLMMIYRKLKWKKEEIQIIEEAIAHFTTLKHDQKKYVLELAKKYNMEEKALEYIHAGKKIYYYGGAFVIYNPFSKISKWEVRLSKLIKE